jgi:hypothetical protein
MNENQKISQSRNFVSVACNIFKIVGNFFTLVGCVGISLGLAGVYNLDIFSYGLSSGIRIVGSLAIAGCLLSAIGYGISDFF